MDNINKQQYVGFIILVVIIVLGVFLLKGKDVVAPSDNDNIVIDSELTDTLSTDDTEVKPMDPVIHDDSDIKTSSLSPEQQTLLTKLEKSVNARDFELFALLLLEVYKNQWIIPDFIALESQLYVYATNEYWVKEDLENSLRVASIVYDKVPEAWRFRYLRVITLEKYGRNAFNAGDLTKAEDYATQILNMMFRPEGTNLMADIYITKINANIESGNLEMAKQNLGYIFDFEVSDTRRETLNNLKAQLGL